MSQQTDKFERLTEIGEQLVRDGRTQEALATFSEAWASLAEPKEEHDAAVGILGAIADCCFLLSRWSDCCNAVQQAFVCGADPGNVFFRLRLGESLFELGNHKESANWLVPVYLNEGIAPFSGEDPKYLESFKGQLASPSGGWPDGW